MTREATVINNILIIDYKVGNHSSIIHALKELGYNPTVSDKISDIKKARSYILPGVGAFGEAMRNLQKLELIETLKNEVLINKKPLLGICLGMQVLAEDSEENGFHKGLGWIRGHIMKIKGENLRVPHVGWNNVTIKKNAPLFIKTPENPHFYFDHSYQFLCDGSFVSATCDYGEEIIVAVQKDNIFGVQFHPEKSQNNGLKLLRGFFNNI